MLEEIDELAWLDKNGIDRACRELLLKNGSELQRYVIETTFFDRAHNNSACTMKSIRNSHKLLGIIRVPQTDFERAIRERLEQFNVPALLNMLGHLKIEHSNAFEIIHPTSR